MSYIEKQKIKLAYLCFRRLKTQIEGKYNDVLTERINRLRKHLNFIENGC